MAPINDESDQRRDQHEKEEGDRRVRDRARTHGGAVKDVAAVCALNLEASVVSEEEEGCDEAAEEKEGEPAAGTF